MLTVAVTGILDWTEYWTQCSRCWNFFIMLTIQQNVSLLFSGKGTWGTFGRTTWPLWPHLANWPAVEHGWSRSCFELHYVNESCTFPFFTAGDPIDFMSWLLNALHASLNGSKKLSSSIINQTFRGLYRALQTILIRALSLVFGKQGAWSNCISSCSCLVKSFLYNVCPICSDL